MLIHTGLHVSAKTSHHKALRRTFRQNILRTFVIRKMWPIQLSFRLLISRRIFLCSLTLSNTSPFLTRLVQLISMLLQHHISQLSRCFWSGKFWNMLLDTFKIMCDNYWVVTFDSSHAKSQYNSSVLIGTVAFCAGIPYTNKTKVPQICCSTFMWEVMNNSHRSATTNISQYLAFNCDRNH
jgi:hypothetical protein